MRAEKTDPSTLPQGPLSTAPMPVHSHTGIERA